MKRFVLAVLPVAIAAFFAFGSQATAGTIVADSGFKVDQNGFSFDNYGGGRGYKELDTDQMRRLFGNVVCLSGGSGECVLTPTARTWMDTMNEGIANGHCYGFSVLAEIIQRDRLPAFGYKSLAAFGGGSNAFGLNIIANPVLQANLARAWTFQTLQSVSDHKVEGTPKQILQKLIEVLNPSNRETYTMSIYKPGFEEGHAITPVSVEDLGGGKYDVHVYDNNWAGDADRSLRIDTTTNEWYYLSATNPNQPSDYYRGDATTHTLSLDPTTPALHVQPCPFCGGQGKTSSKTNEVTLSSAQDDHAHLLITDRKGRKTGFVNGKLVNRIPGAQVVPRMAGGPNLGANGDITGHPNSLEPLYRIPKRMGLKIDIEGSNLPGVHLQSVSVVGPTFDSTVDDLKVGPGLDAVLRLSPKKRTLSLQGPKKKSTPKVSFGARSEDDAYRIQVSAEGAPGGRTFYFAKKPKKDLLRIGEKGNASQSYRVYVTRFDDEGNLDEYGRSYSIGGKQQAYLYYRPLSTPKGLARIVLRTPGSSKNRVLKVEEIDD